MVASSLVFPPVTESPAPAPAIPATHPEFRSPQMERLLTEEEQLELDRRRQAELERQGAAAGKD